MTVIVPLDQEHKLPFASRGRQLRSVSSGQKSQKSGNQIHVAASFWEITGILEQTKGRVQRQHMPVSVLGQCSSCLLHVSSAECLAPRLIL